MSNARSPKQPKQDTQRDLSKEYKDALGIEQEVDNKSVDQSSKITPANPDRKPRPAS